MNDDASTFELPEYIHSRLQPQIFIDFPERDEEYQILQENLPFAEERILQYVTDFLQLAHAADERYTVRDGINMARFAIKLKSLATERTHETEALEIAIAAGAGRGGAALCPERIDLPDFLTPAVCGAAGSPTSRWCPGGWNSPSRCARRFCATGRKWSRVELPATLARQPGCGQSRGCRRCP